jgi:hypothetical protein
MHPFRAAVEAGSIDAMLDLLAADVVCRSPVVFRPYHGRDAVAPVLHAVSEVFEDLRYVREIGSYDAADHALVFHASIGGRHVEGSDFIHVNENGMITELAVMLRPLGATLALAEAMNARLGPVDG